jgi:hypothetical protein
MTANLTYTSLINNVLKYLNRLDDESLIAEMPTIVMLAQKRIDNDLKNLGQVEYVVSEFSPPSVDSTQNVIAKPVNWKNTLTFAIGIDTLGGTNYQYWKQLELVGYDFLKTFWPNSTDTGTPRYYADFGYDNWIVAPTPYQNNPIQVSYISTFPPLQVSYISTVPPLISGNETNWLTNNAPQLLFYATLMEAMIYTQFDQRLQLIQAEYEKLKTALTNTDMARITDRASTRDKD